MIFITGGARSGKSGFAEQLAAGMAGGGGAAPDVIYIATARPGDGEMQARIAEHRRRRPAGWETVEAFSGLPDMVAAALAGGATVLVDCLTVYISNLLLTGGLDAGSGLGHQVDAEIDRLIGSCGNGHGSGLIIVSNEVGMGIVPENGLARAFRDIAGRANQRLAAAADAAYLCVSGIPVKLK